MKKHMNRAYNRNVLLTGATSFFTDISSEMVYPLLQAFLAAIMAAHAALLGPVLGVIEGISEATASLLKLFSGFISDKLNKRKTPAIMGYGLSAVAKLLLLLASLGWQLVLFSRFFDRVGKGIRSAPRDALIAESTPKGLQGRAFGLQRGMDFAGAMCGAAFCWFFVRNNLDPVTNKIIDLGVFYRIFIISIVPAFIGVAFLFFIQEPSRTNREQKTAVGPDLHIRNYNATLRMFFLVQIVFTLGNSSNQFLLLRSVNLGHALSSVILMYLLFNGVSSALSPLFGSLSDRVGRKAVLAAGYCLYSIVYGAFGLLTAQSHHLVWVFWALYGVFYALTEGAEKAFVAQLAPAQSKATALGFSHMIVGIGLLPASVMAGALFAVAPAAPFLFGSAMSMTAMLIMVFFIKQPRVKLDTL